MKYLLVLGISFSLLACASQGPIIDQHSSGFDNAQYQKDLAECQQISEQVKNQVGNEAVTGAVVGGLLGALSGDVAEGASAGAIVGGAGGYGESKSEKKQVLHNCLRGRGYNVLN